MERTTFKTALARWVQTRSLHKRPKTIELYSLVEKFVLKHWECPEIELDQITPEHVLGFAHKISGFSETYWNNSVSVLRYITPHGALLKRRPAKLREFTPPGQSQFAAFLAECDRANSPAGMIVRFLCLTGCRISEAHALRWENVFEDRIEVPASVAKSGKRRSIPFVPGLREILARLRNLGHETVLPPVNTKKAIRNACVRAGVPKMSFHCFRHYYATRCIESGVDVPTVSRWLGHQDGGALASKVYFHLLDEHSQRMAERVKIAA
ncbi:MAG: tyrosine-type recombinase/integrase [Limisphaerales bacterium]